MPTYRMIDEPPRPPSPSPSARKSGSDTRSAIESPTKSEFYFFRRLFPLGSSLGNIEVAMDGDGFLVGICAISGRYTWAYIRRADARRLANDIMELLQHNAAREAGRDVDDQPAGGGKG